MAVPQAQGSGPAAPGQSGLAARRPAAAAGPGAALLLALGMGAALALFLDRPAFFDNEGRYAAVAREMVLSGDWITPTLDGTLFLNKPPLTYWLAAAVFAVGGLTEWARLVPLVAGIVALFATCRLGTLLYGGSAGLIGGVALATTLGFALETHILRPDMIVIATLVVALLCWQHFERGDRRWLAGMYAALGVGMLAKGLVPVVLAGVPIGVFTLRDHGLAGIRRLRPVFGLAVMAAIVLPWHVLVSLAHPGFAWDYVVNQHILAFLDKKLPRDSEGDRLVFFWQVFAGRALPWTLLLPLTAREAVRGLARSADAVARGTALLWVWIGGVLFFFSLAPSRLEHYSLPALPAVALLAARVWQRARAGELGGAAWTYLAVAGGAIAAAGAVGLAIGRGLLARTYWIPQAPGLLDLAVAASLAVMALGLLTLVAARRRRAGGLVAALAVGGIPFIVIVLRALGAAAPIFTWREVARSITTRLPPTTEVVFESPEEYQLVGGLTFYVGRRITLLEPPGFVPPTYLAQYATTMFLSRPEFERRWRAGEPLAMVSSPLEHRDTPEGIAPAPFHVLARHGDRWVLTNFPVPGAS